MPNFTFLADIPEYDLFASSCIEAEDVYPTSPSLCCLAVRKAVELGVKWVYSADDTMTLPYDDKLGNLIHAPCFRDEIDQATWLKLKQLIFMGNKSAHTSKKYHKTEALVSLMTLFEFVDWIDCCYGTGTVERKFDEKLLPTGKVDPSLLLKIENLERLLAEKDDLLAEQKKEIEQSLKKVEKEAPKYTKQKEKPARVFQPTDLSEFKTRKMFIDVALKSYGWVIGDDCLEEVEVNDMDGNEGQKGYIDYVLMGKDGVPLAVVEAKRSSKDPTIGKQQAKLYADCLERKYGTRPFIFYTNGFETYFWDDSNYPTRLVSFVFSKKDLDKLIKRRNSVKDLQSIEIDDTITDRYYQKEAIRSVCQHFTTGHRKALLVMATGTGKTRTASSLVDVFSRGNFSKNVLFLADRRSLVKQAHDDFKDYLPSMSLCNLLKHKEDKNARIVFSTYPTILNSIDSAKTEDGFPLFTPAHFDVIIIDEAHRSIFNKYKAIFQFFDGLLVGLTATPKTDVDTNTYAFFDIQNLIPTFAYDYETAVNKDKVLVPYYAIETKTKFMEDGILYEQLSEADKKRFEEDFSDIDGCIPDYIPSQKLNKFVFNENTVDTVLTDLMEKGIKIKGGDTIGKTIIFAQNTEHAKFIVARFDALYPKKKGGFAERIVCEDSYSESLLEKFKLPHEMPQIAVSVDMLDTGIDVPEVVNLVFFKKVRSKTKFWQMIGRGTRLCPGLECQDTIDGFYTDKRRFFIFDYCSNFEYFGQKPDGVEGVVQRTLSEVIFENQVKLILALQNGKFASKEYEEWRKSLVTIVTGQINDLNEAIVSVRIQLKFKEKYKKIEAFTMLQEVDVIDLVKNIAPLIQNEEPDEYAKGFDRFMYSFMLMIHEQKPSFAMNKKKLCEIATLLESNGALPQIKPHLPLIQSLQTDSFWNRTDLIRFEEVRVKLRHLLVLIVDKSPKGQPIYTNLKDDFSVSQQGATLDNAYDFEDYRIKVNRYIEENKDSLAVWKLRNNEPLSSKDYESLANIFTHELGTEEDYQENFGETPFGLLIRKIGKLERDAAMKVFSSFINEQNLNQQQITFVHKIIDYVVENGYLENASDIMKPPFDKPQNFMKLFDASKQKELMSLISSIKLNAVTA
ncbi:MAG: DEAD/DEAH box helicase family protein [Eubacteriales bacterium]